MKKVCFFLSVMALAAIAVFAMSSVYAQEITGAKALFNSGSVAVKTWETPVSGSVAKAPAKKESKRVAKSKPETEKYVGISYKIARVTDDGRIEIVPKSRVFRSGERFKILVTANQPGYLTIFNIGPSGNTHHLFKGYVNGFTPYAIPSNTNLVFQGEPGTERIMMMLSNSPNTFDGTATTASLPAMPQQNPNIADSQISPDAEPVEISQDAEPATSYQVAAANAIEGSKDIVPEDSLETRYAVVSPRNNWKADVNGIKDIVLESDNGDNYGVVPASLVENGKVLTLDIKLKHR